MSIIIEPFGETRRGEPVDLYTLDNGRGVRVKAINYGATIVSAEIADRNGVTADVVLGFDNMEGYLGAYNPHMGCCCGRYANRIAKGRFVLDDVEYSLACNNGDHALHGGLAGFDKKVWSAGIEGNALRMELISPDGEEGYPGTLRVSVLISLSTEGGLRLDYEAETDKKTIINLTNHTYFNLAGGGSVRGHVLRINADQYVVVDDAAIPTGELRAVAGSEMDFLIPTPIGRNIDAVQGLGYDHNYCIKQAEPEALTLAASVLEPSSGRTLECWSTEPGLQLYTANYLDGVPGKKGVYYNKQEGFCLETQHYPDSPNQPAFPSTELAPGETYSQTCIYQFGIKK